MEVKTIFKDLKSDLPASIVVFFVAVPLCLGIASASGAPLFAGIIAGIVVGIASGSPLGVCGPAAGLAVIVLIAIETLGSWPAFLLAVVLAGIGLLIILKQIPHALGYDKDTEGDLSYFQTDGEDTLSSIVSTFDALTPCAALVAAIAILILWDVVLIKKHKLFQLIQGPIVVVFVGILMDYFYQNRLMNCSLAEDHLAKLPVANNFAEFFGQFTFPDFSAITRFEVWKAAVAMAIVASLETLLCVEATDKLDPNKRVTPTNRELKAQGLGNIVTGLIGGLPVTQVIVRSSANIAFGGKTKLSAILHGIFLLISAMTIAGLLNMITLASLAAILIMVGYKLAKPALFQQMYQLGWEQYVPLKYIR